MRVAIGAFLLAVLALAGEARAAELVMFEEPSCLWCRRWHAEIGPGYPRTTEGKLAPLRRQDIRERIPAGWSLSAPVTATPTFVLMDNGKEVGRIVGYPGADFFYGMLVPLLARIAQDRFVPAVTAKGRLLTDKRPLC